MVTMEQELAVDGLPVTRGQFRYIGKAALGAAMPRMFERLPIWLILPVVICLSQRLSHACLSTYFYIVKPRMAH